MNRREFSQLVAVAMLGEAVASAGIRSAPITKGVRFSFMLWALAKQASFDRSVEIVAAAGYQGIELVGEFQKWSPEETQRILGRMRSLGMVFDSMSGVRAGFAVPADSELFLAQFKEHIQSAVTLECPQVILLSGRRVEGLQPSEQRQASIENLKRASDLAAAHQIEIVIEPIDPLENPTIFLQTVTDGFDIAHEVNRPNVKVLYDVYHEQRAFGNLIEKFEKHIDQVGLIHIADVPGRHEPGTGEIGYENIYRKLAELHYDRFIAMEYYPTEEPVASLRKSREAAQQALGIKQ